MIERILAILVVLVAVEGLHHHFCRGHDSDRHWCLRKGVVPIDRGIEYSQILPFSDEWDAFFRDSLEKTHLSPFQFWFRCIDREVRGYFYVERLSPLDHDKEAYMQPDFYRHNLKITADGEPVDFRVWNGGGDIFFNISANASIDHMVIIKIDGFKHFTRFPVSKCHKARPVSTEQRFIMNSHLKDFAEKYEFNPVIVEGVLNHMYYHRCALRLDKYEMVVQSEYVSTFLANEKIARAVEDGWLTLLVRNPVIPSPIKIVNSSSCYYMAYTQNMAILQHWKENVKIYFFDTDEYVNSAPDVTSQEFFQIVNNHTSVALMRRMIFCKDCDQSKPDITTISLTKSTLMLNDHLLSDPKLVVDPNRVGCFIVHWAGCGDVTIRSPVERLYIIHFEELYTRRWGILDRLSLGNETVFKPPPMVEKCDPSRYDWTQPLPNFHLRKQKIRYNLNLSDIKRANRSVRD